MIMLDSSFWQSDMSTQKSHMMCLKKYNEDDSCIYIEVASKDFHKQRQVTDKFTIQANIVVLPVKVPFNNGTDWQYIVCYQVDRETMVLLDHCWCRNPYMYKMLGCTFKLIF